MDKATSKLLGVDGKNLSDDKGKLFEENKRLKEKASYRLYKEFLENPYILPINVTNRRIVVPEIRIDPFKPSFIKGGLPIQKSKDELEEEFQELAKKAYPVVAYDPKIKESVELSDSEINYAILSSFTGIAKMIYFKGLKFMIMEFHEVVGFVNKSELSLLSLEIPEQEIEKQRQLEQKDESTIQSNTTSIQ